MISSWYREISRTQTCEDIVSLARDYVASWAYRDIRSIPEHCRPMRIRDIDDVHFWRQCLADEYIPAAASPEAAAIRNMLSFFMSAAERASEIQRGVPRSAALDELSRSGTFHVYDPSSVRPKS